MMIDLFLVMIISMFATYSLAPSMLKEKGLFGIFHLLRVTWKYHVPAKNLPIHWRIIRWVTPSFIRKQIVEIMGCIYCLTFYISILFPALLLYGEFFYLHPTLEFLALIFSLGMAVRGLYLFLDMELSDWGLLNGNLGITVFHTYEQTNKDTEEEDQAATNDLVKQTLNNHTVDLNTLNDIIKQLVVNNIGIQDRIDALEKTQKSDKKLVIKK